MIRRRQLLMGGVGLGLPLLWHSLRSWLPVRVFRDSDSSRLARLFKSERSARVVGQEYLRGTPEEARQDVLTALIVGRLAAGHRGLGAATDGQVRELLVRAAQQDFQEGRTVELHGWVLSQTEVRLCALAAVHIPAPSATAS